MLGGGYSAIRFAKLYRFVANIQINVGIPSYRSGSLRIPVEISNPTDQVLTIKMPFVKVYRSPGDAYPVMTSDSADTNRDVTIAPNRNTTFSITFTKSIIDLARLLSASLMDALSGGLKMDVEVVSELVTPAYMPNIPFASRDTYSLSSNEVNTAANPAIATASNAMQLSAPANSTSQSAIIQPNRCVI